MTLPRNSNWEAHCQLIQHKKESPREGGLSLQIWLYGAQIHANDLGCTSVLGGQALGVELIVPDLGL